MVIDLTKSSRFYREREIQENGCKYLKIACKGNEETPTPEQVQLFNRVVTNFEEKEDGKKICVHCTHGFNRTGFLSITFLVEERNYGCVSDYASSLRINVSRGPCQFVDSKCGGLITSIVECRALTVSHRFLQNISGGPQLSKQCHKSKDLINSQGFIFRPPQYFDSWGAGSCSPSFGCEVSAYIQIDQVF